MSVYLIYEIKITDRAKFDEYRRLAPPIIERYGGRYVVRGGAAKNVEGDWIPERIVILEFGSELAANDFLGSSDYAPIRLIRLRSSNSRCIMVESIDHGIPANRS
jgi:uncharacterized protein (DUF1330 family)